METMSTQQDGQHRYKYGGGPFLITIGVVFIIVILYMHDEMTSGKTEWHLWSTRLPIIIPPEVMVGFWWVSLLFFGACTLIALLPSAIIIVDQNEISAQNPITRSFKTIAFANVRYVETGDKTLSIHDRNGAKIAISQAMMSKREYKEILATVQDRSRYIV